MLKNLSTIKEKEKTNHLHQAFQMAEKHSLVVHSLMKLTKLISFERLKMIDDNSGSESEENEG